MVIPEDLSSGAFPEKDTTPNAVTAMQALDDFLGFHFHYHTLKDGDVFTVGGRRGGSCGLMLIAVDSSGRVVFKTDQQSWRVYIPGERSDWYQPGVASSSPKSPVTVQPDPWYPQKELNKKFNNIALSIWGVPSETFSYLTATVSLK